ncbi:MAG: hypothetical protein HS115_02090 [Spirochaetales bacterium]|nr:hypothetical protein [Spirochaetales bacterium]
MQLTAETLGLTRGPVAISAASCSKDLRPHFVRAWAVRAEAEASDMTVVFPRLLGGPLLIDLCPGAWIAVSITNLTNFQSRQFKGRVKEVRDMDAEEREWVALTRKESGDMIEQYFGPGAGQGWKSYATEPAVAITFAVEEAYDQTPGKKAGEKLA